MSIHDSRICQHYHTLDCTFLTLLMASMIDIPHMHIQNGKMTNIDESYS